jgi:hypothetical protein
MVDTRPRLSPLAWLVGGFLVALQLYAAGRYGIFRDELYYLMCADNPAWGYVDHPPLAMFFLSTWKSVVGDGLLAMRVPPAVLHGLVAVGAAGIAREMRGNDAAQVLAAVLVGLMPGIVALGGFYSMNAFDVAFWVLVTWITCQLLGDGDRRWWWALGVAFGLGILNKYSMVFLGVGLGLGLLLSPLRSELLSRNRLIGSTIVVVILLPHLIWQFANGWPTLEFMNNVQEFKNAEMTPGTFWGEQLLIAHPGFLPFWLVGLFGLLLMPRLRVWRPLGIAFGIVAVWLTFSNAKPYYLAAAYPTVMAAGALVVTEWLERWSRVSSVTQFVLPAVVLALGLIVAPLTIPVLEVEDYIAWEQTLGLRPKDMENNATGALPQHFADRFGWEELTRAVAKTWNRIPEEDREATLIYAGNYGECGAVNYYGPELGLPTAVSGHNSCFTWWPEEFVPETLIVIGANQDDLEELFASVELAGRNDAPWAMPYESDVAIWICRDPTRPWNEIRSGARRAI